MATSQYLINSFHAVDKATGQVIAADAQGYITPAAGTEIVFANPVQNASHAYVEVTDFVVETGENPVRLIINDNEMYPLYVASNDSRGMTNAYVYQIKVVSGGPFRYEALASRT